MKMPRAVILCLCLVFTAEIAARMMVRTGRLEQDNSLQKNIEDNLYALKQYQPRVWFMGNSTLYFGIDQKQLSKDLGLQIIKLVHGGATMRGSAAMLDFYLGEASFKPEYVLLLITKDDLNPNSIRVINSQRYLQAMTWRKYLLLHYSYLRSIRGRIYRIIASLWSRLFIKQKDLESWREKYVIIKVSFDSDTSIERMMKNYTIDTDGLLFFLDVCRQYGIKHIGIILLPISEEYRKRHDREFPREPYEKIRDTIDRICRMKGITYIDLGDPLPKDYFADFYHLGGQGCEYISTVLSKKLSFFVKPGS